jgi:hypothetical protein
LAANPVILRLMPSWSATPEGHHRHEDEQAEDDADRGQRGAQLVARQAGGDLVEAVDVEHQVSRIASTGLILAAA